jgi:hypothetical protein
MPSYIPTITTFNNGIVSVISTDSTSYESILNSMGSHVYGVLEIYLKAETNLQILEGFVVEQYDVNGYIKSFNQKPTVDPYQFQKSVFFNLAKENVVLNGQTRFDMTILPNEVIYMVIYADVLATQSYLSSDSVFDNNFFNNFSDVL